MIVIIIVRTTEEKKRCHVKSSSNACINNQDDRCVCVGIHHLSLSLFNFPRFISFLTQLIRVCLASTTLHTS